MKNTPLIIGITGGSGSGKTSFIVRILENFTSDEICIISQDDYYKPRDQQEKDKNGIKNFDLPSSIEKEEFARDIEKLKRGETVYRKEYVFNNELKNPKMLEFKPAPVIIVEGLFVFHFKKIRKLIDLRIFIDAKENLKVIRRIKRDRVERNYPLSDVLYRYEHHVLPTYEKYIKPFKDKADIIVNNNKEFEMGAKVVRGFLSNYLRQRRNKKKQQSVKILTN